MRLDLEHFKFDDHVSVDSKGAFTLKQTKKINSQSMFRYCKL